MEDSTSVVSDLFEEMSRTVTAYGLGVVKVNKCVNGTAFFPGGLGLWRGSSPMGAIPALFPTRPVMILGHNFDSVRRLNAFCEKGIEPMNVGTWFMLLEYLWRAGLKPEECFFTNIYVGLQPNVSRGELKGDKQFKEQCRRFFHYQVKRIQPRLIVVLGIPAAEQFELSGSKTNHVKIDHPSYAANCGATPKREVIVARAAARVISALNSAVSL